MLHVLKISKVASSCYSCFFISCVEIVLYCFFIYSCGTNICFGDCGTDSCFADHDLEKEVCFCWL
ncbi:hypothetical protein LOK49_LG08G02261 [Camellia lanceoleosa]|uniref:Uncharacterized protein n=1 Tax=Camellia lanceoleosa TaxID=1840588 RepID=A0ACC0GW02_9ERIC|nr:hypothetical protein LOK49_LG08G02261 [Camellia lanceoleosa]